MAGHDRRSYLRQRSVSEKTRTEYHKHADAFFAWAGHHRVLTRDKYQLDSALECYLDDLFFEGYESYTARYTIWGIGFVRDLIVSARELPKAHRALRGWAEAAPELGRMPAPWFAVAVGCDALSSQAAFTALGERVALGSARAGLLQFDTFARPAEVIRVRHCDIVPPVGNVHTWAVVFNPRPSGLEGDAADMRRASFGLGRAPRSKQRTYDNTVQVCDAASIRAGRVLVRKCLEKWYHQMSAELPCFDITSAEYARAWKWASETIGLDFVVTPHMLRHGGASADYALGCRDILAIQERGQWGSLRSVQRYKKAGAYQRMLLRLPETVWETHRARSRLLPSLLSVRAAEKSGARG